MIVRCRNQTPVPIPLGTKCLTVRKTVDLESGFELLCQDMTTTQNLLVIGTDSFFSMSKIPVIRDQPKKHTHRYHVLFDLSLMFFGYVCHILHMSLNRQVVIRLLFHPYQSHKDLINFLVKHGPCTPVISVRPDLVFDILNKKSLLTGNIGEDQENIFHCKSHKQWGGGRCMCVCYIVGTVSVYRYFKI